MPSVDFQYTQAHRARWSIIADSEEVILNVAAGDVAHNLIKQPLACLAPRAKFFPSGGSSPNCPHDAIAVRGLLEQTLLLDVVTHVLSDVCVWPSTEGEYRAIATSVLERHVIASCADTSSGQWGSCKEAADARLFYRVALRRTATSLSEFGIGSTSAFPVGQLRGPKCLTNSADAHPRSTEQSGILRSQSLNQMGFDAPNDPRLWSRRYRAGIVGGSCSFALVQCRHSFSASHPQHSLRFSEKTQRILTAECDQSPLATRLAHCYGLVTAWDSLAVLSSVLDQRSMTCSVGSHLFFHTCIRNVRSKIDPAKDPAVERACCIKNFPRTCDVRRLASGQGSVVIEASEPLAIRPCSTAYSNSVDELLIRSRPHYSSPQTHFIEGAQYHRFEIFNMFRVSGNQTGQNTVALIDRAGLLTFDQIGLHVLANGILDSGPISDACLFGISMGGWVIQNASPLLEMSCGSLRAAFFMDSRMQLPMPLIQESTSGKTLQLEVDTCSRSLSNVENYNSQSAARFRLLATHIELPILNHTFFVFFHSTVMDMISRLALLSQDPNVQFFSDGHHDQMVLNLRLDTCLGIRTHMKQV